MSSVLKDGYIHKILPKYIDNISPFQTNIHLFFFLVWFGDAITEQKIDFKGRLKHFW